MAKIELDKYYTSDNLAKYCVDKTIEIIGNDNITEFLEPSAGNGVFLKHLDKPYIAYDIEPEGNGIIKQDFLELELEYKEGRCIIGNPPFGRGNTSSVKFYKKSLILGDYIAFILPISQFNNNYQMYEFDLIHSEDLGLHTYTDRKLHCCFNIYKRPKGELNKKPNYKLSDVEIFENRRNAKQIDNMDDFDIGICSYGSGIIGRIPTYKGQYVKEFYFKIHNEKLKDKIIELIKNTNWEKDVCRGMSGQLNLSQWQVYKYIKEQFKDIN